MSDEPAKSVVVDLGTKREEEPEKKKKPTRSNVRVLRAAKMHG